MVKVNELIPLNRFKITPAIFEFYQAMFLII